jgi:hypothetical protein
VRSISNRGLSLWLAVVIGGVQVVPVGSVHAGPAAKGAESEDLERAKELYEKGRARYETFDYDGAIALWTEAYALVPESAAGTRNLLTYNIATAQEKAYDLDHDVARLKKAKLLVEGYIANYKALHKATPETRAEVEKAEERIAGLEQRIAEHGDPAPEPVAAPPPVTEAPAPTRTPDPPEVVAERRKIKGLIAGGYASVGVGAAALVASGISFGVASIAQTTADAESVLTSSERSARTAQRARIAGWVLLGLGVGGIVAAGTLLGIGYSRRAKLNRRQASVLPYGGLDGGGLAMRVRF